MSPLKLRRLSDLDLPNGLRKLGFCFILCLFGLAGAGCSDTNGTTADAGALGASDVGVEDALLNDSSAVKCSAPSEPCGGACLPPCPPGSHRPTPASKPNLAEACSCWGDAVALPASGTLVADTACISGFIPTGAGVSGAAKRNKFFDAMKYLGVRAIRQHFLWHAIQPKKGAWSWDAMDRVVAAAKVADVEIVGLLAYGAPWASKEGKLSNDYHYPPDDPADFGVYAAAVAKRYGSTVHRWEIWNEQNAGYRFWKGNGLKGDPAAYGALLAVATEAIHGVDPTATVGYGGLFYYPQLIAGAEQFLDDSLKAAPSALKKLDALAFHPYPPYPPMLAPEDAPPAKDGALQRYAFDTMVTRLRAVLSKHTKKQLPVWVTEVGWPIGLGLSEDQVAHFLVRGYALLLKEGVDLLCWYTYIDHDPKKDTVAPWEGVFGLYGWPEGAAPAKPKRTALAHHTFFKVLGDTRFVADRREGEGWNQLVFASQKDKVVHVVWDWKQPAGTSRAVSLPARKGRVYRAVGLTGEALDVKQTEPHAVELQVSATPTYVISEPQS